MKIREGIRRALIITNIGNNSVVAKHFKLYSGETVKITRKGNKVIISSPCVDYSKLFYYNENGKYIYSYNVGGVYDILNKEGIEGTISETYKEAKKSVPGDKDKIRRCIANKPRITEFHKYNEVKCIRYWKKIEIDLETGKFAVLEDYGKPNYFSVNLKSKEGYKLLKSWTKRVKKYVDYAIDKKEFLPSLTGGLDTRVLTAFYRNRIDEIDNYFLKAVKSDGKNNVEKGADELVISSKVMKRLTDRKVERTEREINGDAATLSGLFTENGRNALLMNREAFIQEFMDYHDFSANFIKAFSLVEYLTLKHKKPGLMRCVLALIFCEDLLDIPLVGFSGKYSGEGYSFYNKPVYKPNGILLEEGYGDLIDEAKEILDFWGAERVKELRDILA